MAVVGGFAGLDFNNYDGLIYTTDLNGITQGEIFEQYKANLNHNEVPWQLFAPDNIVLWCTEHGTDVDGKMTTTERHYWAYNNPEVTNTQYDRQNPYKYYGRDMGRNSSYGKEVEIMNGNQKVLTKIIGLIPDHKSPWRAFCSQIRRAGCNPSTPDYYGDDQAAINANNLNMPGIGTPIGKSIQYHRIATLDPKENQHALFVLTQKRIYENATQVPESDSVTQYEKENAYFTLDEKQSALWEIGVPLNTPNGNPNDKNDRMLGTIALKYQEFYEALHNGRTSNGVTNTNKYDPEDRDDNYGDIVTAYNVDTKTNKPKDGQEGRDVSKDIDVFKVDENGNEILEPGRDSGAVEINGKKHTTYKYKDTQVEMDSKENSFVLGPYCIKYAFDDTTKDTYEVKDRAGSSNFYGPQVDNDNIYENINDELIEETDNYDTKLRFDAIEKITVYNQNKKDIKTLGGTFKIAYKYNGAIPGDGEKLPHINELNIDNNTAYYYVFADGEEVPAFLSKEPFYIVVYRGTMQAKDFTGFYAKIDFQYLESIEGELFNYEGQVVYYWYSRGDVDWNPNYKGSFDPHISDNPHKDDPTQTEYWNHAPLETKLYILNRMPSVERSQQMLGYKYEGFRIYKRYSIILTSDFEVAEPRIKILKQCDAHGELYGAEFNVTAKIVNGKDIYGNELAGREVYFTRVTNKRGVARITTEDFEAKGIYLGTLGTSDEPAEIIFTFEETYLPAGHEKVNQNSKLHVVLEKGKITKAYSATSNRTRFSEEEATIIIENKEAGTPKIQLAKVNSNNGLIEEAYFNIHVIYTDEHGLVVDKKSNIIRGQTKHGLLNLTVEDFKNMRYPLDIQGYTGRLTLNITEIAVDSGYSISSNGMTITLTFKNGELTHYTHESDGEVLVHYLYDNILNDIYEWAVLGKNDKLAPWERDYIEKWVDTQLKNYKVFEDQTLSEGWTPKEVKYDDVLEWLADYIKTHYNDQSYEEWKHSVFSTDLLSNKNGDIIQITVEDAPGVYIPDMEFEKAPPVKGILMKVGGTVFLDQTVDKQGIESDGKLTQGEMLLEGIEVTLIDKATGKKAEFVSAEEEYGQEEWNKLTDEQKKNAVRTNPTLTNENGYYEFRGVDPLKDYIVQFTYNGMEFTNTVSKEEVYNSNEWAVSSKASEEQAERKALNNKFSTVTANTKAYDYDVLEGLYKEITNRTWKYIYDNHDKNLYPDQNQMDAIYEEVIRNHSSDDEIREKIQYIKNTKLNAYAGYYSEKGGVPSKGNIGTYPYYSMKNERSMKSDSSVNSWTGSGNDEIVYAGDKVKLLYPGQLQIHLGVIERDSINLSLTTDIVDTTVSINKYDTTYKYGKELSSYKQYMFEEDYNYSVLDQDGKQHKKYDINAGTSDGTAYYTDDGVEFYMTYEAKVKNETGHSANVLELVDYYDKNFEHAVEWGASSYTTTKGNLIPAYKVFLNGNDITSEVEVNKNTKCGVSKEYQSSISSGDYKGLFIKFKNSNRYITVGDDLRIRITFRMNKGTYESVAKNINEHLYEASNNSKYSKSWLIRNFAEINAYISPEGYLDYNSRPGNMDLVEYEAKRTEYQAAYNAYVINTDKNKKPELERAVKLALARLNAVREDDAWTVAMNLTNNGYKRELTGNVWEAIPENSEFKNALGLNKAYGEEYLTYDKAKEEHKLEGIKVELVELEKDGRQIVRAVTKTDANGGYKFTSYIAGDYTIRFVYGDYANTDNYTDENVDGVIRSKVTKYADGTNMPVNGQYYQSTKANPNTDNDKYWYKDREYNEDTLKSANSSENFLTRYSDAYDDAYSRLTQMGSSIDPTDFNNNSIEYDYQGAKEVETVRHTDPIYAYTSTMELEIEYTRQELTGNAKNSWYEYKVNNVDFGITPRATNDVNIDKYVANIKLYLADRSKLIDVTFDKDGKIIKDVSVGVEHLGTTERYTQAISIGERNQSFPDGVIRINYNEQLLQNARVEVTYKITVSNDSIYENKGSEESNVYDRIKYITVNNKTIAVIYYDEDTEKLTSYENEKIVYHNNTDEAYSKDNLVKADSQNRRQNANERLSKYTIYDKFDEVNRPNGYKVGNAEIVKSRASQVIDYPNAPLDFIKTTFENAEINKDWADKKIEDTDFVTSRENYKYEDAYIKVGNPTILKGYSHILVASNNSPLYKQLNPGQNTSDDLTLSVVLGSTTTDATITEDTTTNLTGADYELSNLVEITRLQNSAGKITELEGYDINGDKIPESSFIHKPEELDGDNPKFVPTLSTSKSQTIVIAAPTGLTFAESMIGANLIIALASLVVLAIGLILIKKFVLAPKK